MSAWISVVLWAGPLAVTVVGVFVVWLALRATVRQRDQWKEMADEASLLFRTMPLGVDPRLDDEASKWVAGYNALCEPEKRR